MIDISYASQHLGDSGRPVVRLNIRIPHEKVKTFDVDVKMSQLVLGTNSGNVYIYDLPKALENERILCKKKVDMGVENTLVYTYLERATANEFLSFLKDQTGSAFAP